MDPGLNSPFPHDTENGKEKVKRSKRGSRRLHWLTNFTRRILFLEQLMNLSTRSLCNVLFGWIRRSEQHFMITREVKRRKQNPLLTCIESRPAQTIPIALLFGGAHPLPATPPALSCALSWGIPPSDHLNVPTSKAQTIRVGLS